MGGGEGWGGQMIGSDEVTPRTNPMAPSAAGIAGEIILLGSLAINYGPSYQYLIILAVWRMDAGER